jgi:hypothetical protein
MPPRLLPSGALPLSLPFSRFFTVPFVPKGIAILPNAHPSLPRRHYTAPHGRPCGRTRRDETIRASCGGFPSRPFPRRAKCELPLGTRVPLETITHTAPS